MPNWCNNTLRINGTAEEIAQLNWKDNDSFFAPFIPRPENIGDDWYDWSLRNWGCKWDCQVEIVDDSDDYLEIQLNTPWSPPLSGILKLSILFPNCTFELKYSEPGCDFQGQAIYENGKEIEHLQTSFYGDETKCLECGETYRPEVDLDGDITYNYCYHCHTEF